MRQIALRRARFLRPDERRIVAPALADFLVHGVPVALPGGQVAELPVTGPAAVRCVLPEREAYREREDG